MFETLRYLLAQRLAIGRPVTYVDATNLTPEERRPYLEMGRVWECEVEAVFFDVPLAVCQERNSRRHRVVPAEAMAKMAVKLVPPTTEEGFVRVTSISGVTRFAECGRSVGKRDGRKHACQLFHVYR